MKAPEMVALAKKQGIQITAAQVYVTRYEARRAAGRKLVKKQAGSQGIHLASAHMGSKDPKQEFLQLAVRIGTDAAQQILDALQQGKLAQISA